MLDHMRTLVSAMKVGTESLVSADSQQSMHGIGIEAFQRLYDAAMELEREGTITITQRHQESQSGRRNIDLFRIKRIQ